jgi:hypothetical protein
VLPDDQAWLVAHEADVLKIIWHEIVARSRELSDSYFIGQCAYTTAAGAIDAADEVAQLKVDLLHKLEALELPAELAEAFWIRAPEPDTDIAFDDMVSAALRLARGCIEPLIDEPSTAFVSMPFAEPFADRYRQFYCPLLRAQGLRPVRAWGGVVFEDYWDLLLTLIRKAGSFFADVSGANPNVLHEVGLAEGMGKTAWLVMERSEQLPPSNLGYHAVVMYDPQDSRWPQGAIEDALAIWRAGLRGLKARPEAGR